MGKASTFFANLNVFIAGCIYLSIFGLALPVMIVTLLMAALQLTKYFEQGLVIAYLLIPLALAAIWVRWGLVPASVAPDRAGRYRKGHWIIALTTFAVFLSYAIPGLLAALVNPNMGLYMFYTLPVFVVAAVTWLLGLAFVWTSG